jgi:hypothetical protein
MQLVLAEKIEDAKVISLDEARNDIATSMLREERVSGVIETFAAQLVQAWKDGGAPPVALTEPKHLPIDTTGSFSLADPEIPRLGDNAGLRTAIASAPAGYVVPVPLTIKDTSFVVGVTSRTEADPANFEEQRSLIEGRLLAQRKAAFLDQWRSDVVAQATVTRDKL